MARSSLVDPLEKFRFTVSWNSTSEATKLVRLGFHDVQMPKRTTNKGTYREGISPDVSQVFAGLSSMEDVVLSRGVLPTQYDQQEFYSWASAVMHPSDTTSTLDVTALGARPAQSAANNYRKDITITMLDREGNAVRQWMMYNAWPSHFVPGSDLNAKEDGEKSLEQLTLSYENFMEVKPGTQNEVTTSPSL